MVEGPGGGEAWVVRGGVGNRAEGLAEEGVVPGFDGDCRGDVLQESGIGFGNGSGEVDHGAYADGCDDLCELEEFCGVRHGEGVLTGRDWRSVEVPKEIVECGDVDFFLLRNCQSRPSNRRSHIR